MHPDTGDFDVIIGDLADPVFGGPCYQVAPPALVCQGAAMLTARLAQSCDDLGWVEVKLGLSLPWRARLQGGEVAFRDSKRSSST